MAKFKRSTNDTKEIMYLVAQTVVIRVMYNNIYNNNRTWFLPVGHFPPVPIQMGESKVAPLSGDPTWRARDPVDQTRLLYNYYWFINIIISRLVSYDEEFSQIFLI